MNLSSREDARTLHPIPESLSFTADIARCCILITTALVNGVAEDGESWMDHFNKAYTGIAGRDEILALAVHIEDSYNLLQVHFEGQFGDLMMDIWGGYDEEWIPAMVAMYMTTPKFDVFYHCIAAGVNINAK